MNTIAATLSARSNNRLEVGVILFILTHEKYSAAIARSTTSTQTEVFNANKSKVPLCKIFHICSC